MTPEPLTLDTPFRCTQFACLLTVKACIRRQQETRRKAGKGGANNPVPVHPHCASGTCPQGVTHAAAFPEASFQKSDPRQAPRLDIIRAVEEKTMPKGQLNKKRTCCDTKGGRHKADCTGKPATPARTAAMKRAAKAIMTAAPRATRRVSEPTDQVAESTTADLLAMRSAIDAELRDRLANVEQELLAMRQAVGSSATPPAVRSAG